MRRIDREELKQIQLGILDRVSKFCEEENINYWLDCGTLLGAIRHGGYIPWDDDIDIGMLRGDYERFIHEFNAKDERYKTYCIDTRSDFYYCHGKVLDTNTVLYEPDEKGQKVSVNIDVFVYDNAPDDENELKKAFARRDLYRTLSLCRTQKVGFHSGLVKKAFIQMVSVMLKAFPKNYFIRKMSENAKRYNGIQTKRVGNFTSYSRTCCDRYVFDSFIAHEFEGKMYKIPIGYDEWLRAFYGDYMQLPPVEKRVSHHSFVAYVDD